jgi:hypothetical protein
MACSIAQSEQDKNAHIWLFSAVCVYADVSIIVPSRADLGRFGAAGLPGDLPGVVFFSPPPAACITPFSNFWSKSH